MMILEQAYREFDFEQTVQQHLVGTPDALNAYTECCGRYVGENRTALIWEAKIGTSQQWTFEQLAEASTGTLYDCLRLKSG